MARRERKPAGASEPEREPSYETLEDLEEHGLPAPGATISIPKHIRDLARDYTLEAVRFYAKYARDASLPVPVRKSCWDELMNRAYGKPKDEDARGFDGIIEVRFTKKEEIAPSSVIDVVAQTVAEISEDRPKLLDAMKEPLAVPAPIPEAAPVAVESVSAVPPDDSGKKS